MEFGETQRLEPANYGDFGMARKHKSPVGYLGYLLIISQGYESLYEKDEKVTDQT